MKVAVIGSRNININNICEYLPNNITEIVSGGAKGVDTLAKEFAIKNNIKITEFLPEYNKFGRAAPLKRNDQIIEYADEVVAIWNGKSKGTEYVIKKCKKLSKSCKIYIVD